MGGLRREMDGQRGEMGGLRAEMGGLCREMDGQRGEMGGLRAEMGALRGEMNGQRGEMLGLRGEMNALRTEMNSRFDTVHATQREHGERLSKLETIVSFAVGPQPAGVADPPRQEELARALPVPEQGQDEQA